MKWVLIKNLGIVSTGNTPSKSNEEFYESPDIGFIKPDIISDSGITWIDSTNEYISEKARSRARILKDNAIFVTCIGSIGKIGIARGEYAFNQQINAIETNSNVIPEYLAYCLLANKNRLHDIANAPVVPIINKTQFENFTVKVTENIGEQQKIIIILNKIGNVIKLKNEQLIQMDTLIKARFVEMFGEPETNPMKWPIIAVGSVIKSSESGWSGNGKQRKKEHGEIAVLKVSSVTKGYFIPDECKVLDDQENIKKHVFPQKGDLLFSRANTKEMVGATAVIKQDYPELILPDKLWKIQFSDNAQVFYMKYILSSKTVRDKLSAASTGTSGSMYNISMDKFLSVRISLPPIELQNQFAAFVQQVDKSKTAVQKSLNETQMLFDSLMQKYFRDN